METKEINLGLRFSRIPAGEFRMGLECPPEEAAKRYGGEANWYEPEQPAHRVKISRDYWLATTHVTREQFARFVKETNYRTVAEVEGSAQVWTGQKFEKLPAHDWRMPGFQQGEDHPAVCVNHDDAIAFCQWLGKRENKTFRLPTEAEWEYAYRAGTTTGYFWGNNPDDGHSFANAGDLTAKEKFPEWTTFNWHDGFVFTSPVASFVPNAWKLCDMAGNAWEWTSDWFAPYTSDDQTDPRGPNAGDKRVLRGGSWYGAPLSCRAAYRSRVPTGYRGSNVGFRVLMEE